MPITVKITSPAGQVTTKTLEHGAVFGRGDFEVKLIDPLSSTKHAELRWDTSVSAYSLVDLGSRNGIRVGTSLKKETPLGQGSKFILGSTEFEVLEVAPPPPAADPWNVFFAKFCERALSKIKITPAPLLPFLPMIRLRVIRGLQIEDAWTLGYGPRTFGRNSIDCRVLEPAAPELAFTISPAADAALFSTDYPKVVRLNDNSVSAETLKSGDIIYIGETRIEVTYLE